MCSQLTGAVEFVDLTVEGAKVVGPADAEEAAGKEPEKSGGPFAQIEAVDAEESQEGEQDPRDVVIVESVDVAPVGFAIHAGDEEEVDNPADEKKPAGEEPDHAGDGASVVESVRSCEAENPKKVADGLGVGVVVVHGARIGALSVFAIVEGLAFCTAAVIRTK